MAGPYTGTELLIQIDGNTLGVVTVIENELMYEGGTVVHKYGSRVGDIALGGKRGRFRVQRYFKTDTDPDLLYDLFNTRVGFMLTTEISGVNQSTVGLSNCVANAWRLVTNDVNAIVGEEIAGEATAWDNTDI
jgi:hypothetical protein